MKPTLLILAAGMGSRFGGLKQLEPVGPNGETIMDFSVYDAVKAGFGKVVFVIRESFEDEFKKRFSKLKDQIEVDYAFQEVNLKVPGLELPEREKPWGVVHAVLSAKHLIHEPFAMINADDYYGLNAFKATVDFLSNQAKPENYGLVGYRLENTLSSNGAVTRGICKVNDQNHLVDVAECREVHFNREGIKGLVEGKETILNKNDLASMNLLAFHPHFLDVAQKEFDQFVVENKDNPKAEMVMADVFYGLLNKGAITVSVIKTDDHWLGVTYKDDLPQVKAAFSELTSKGQFAEPLWD